MMSTLELKEDKMLKVQFVGDDDVLSHILDREGESLKNGSAADGGNKVYPFQNRKHPEKMAK
ncbi:ORC2, partial [Cervus elaphus hippelaphus]